MKAQLFAGVASFDVTPPLGYLLQGHAARNKPSVKVHDPLWLKVLTLRKGKRRIALVTSDLLEFAPGFVDEIRSEIRTRTGMKPQDILLTASHTHTGPVMVEWPFGDRAPLPDYLSLLKRTIAGGIGAAMLTERPADVRYGRSSTNIGIVNRRRKTRAGVEMRPDPAGPIDEEVTAVSFVDNGGAPLAILFNYVCHPTTLSPEICQVSADYPGVAQREIQRAYPGAVALFTNGCCGDVRPAIVEGDTFRGGDFQDIERMGKILAAEVIQVTERADPVQIKAINGVLERFEFPLDRKLRVRSKESLERTCRHFGWTSGDAVEWRTFWAKKLAEGAEIPRTLPADLQCLKIGPIAILALPGEAMVEIGLQIKQKLRKVMVAGYGNGCLTYLPTRQALEDGGYEALSFLFEGYPGPYAASMEKKLVAAAVKLVRGTQLRE